MRLYCIMTLALAVALVTGCEEPQAAPSPNANLDVELVKTLNNIGVENAIITQHTLYPYHFTADGEQLNELGRRDLAVLARHFGEHAGVLNVHRGEAPDSLYQARVAHVLDRLKAAGVRTDRISVSEGMPGGTGMLSEQVISILQKAPQTLTTGSSGAMGTVRR